MSSDIVTAKRAESSHSPTWREVFGLLQAAASESGDDRLEFEYLCETCAKQSLARAHYVGAPADLFFRLKRCVAAGHKLTRIK